MSEASCPLCPLVAALERAGTYRDSSGATSRRVALLPTSVVILGTDQFYRGYTLLVAASTPPSPIGWPSARRPPTSRTCSASPAPWLGPSLRAR